mmetsp:Transcript_11625/g.34255  ORF Transcript_11625/g.34255 Transcript_11625/m.34255 type:complete len:218 (+) Transcript_11625:685-1338(+)
MAPTSPGNCSSNLKIARAAFRSQALSGTSSSLAAEPGERTGAAGLMCCAPLGRNWARCSLLRRWTKSLSWADETSGSQAINDSNTLCNASFCAFESRGPAVKTASCASVEIQAANSGCLRKWTAISDSRRNPHMASKGVSAMAISGLWFASLYKSGLSLWSFSARDLSGCAWMDKAFPALRTFSNQGRLPPLTTLDNSVPSSNNEGPEGCVPSQISA